MLIAATGTDGRFPTALTDAAPALRDVRQAVDAALAETLAAKRRSAAPALRELIDTLHGFLFAGGKRIRPVMCLCGWYAADGRGDPEPVVRAAASLELFHTFALIHDDVMDNSDLRRGRSTVHRSLADLHRSRGGTGDADQFGRNAAVLLGDLALTLSDELLHTSLTPDQLRAGLPVIDTMRTEVVFGQYLDLLGIGRPIGDLAHALELIRFKTAKYTVERPLHLGGALAGCSPAVADACTAYALPLGEAFQLRDDLLGAFGDPTATGKPAVDDFREGKCTVLMALAVARADQGQLRLLRSLVGRPDLTEEQADAVRAVLEATGARHAVERMIARRCRRALAALDRASFPRAATAVLRQLAYALSARTS
ncbi:polyprenyl synthetase family protein [Streptomyces aurantiogriseus]|uniref:Geranylgeranyl pyrophosphate synthase n=1 Tax=Streptomyces aurantiogriseus TaxID=66870 RepID=A0A918CI59_9ACTN|nr:polyprenyl synthetase family protein [Streptomyces aurantiogriseus]GGR25572.1 geranylgeranyl pyrophosphate synthase [Streptomyces aurantiogriseus]